MNERPILFSGPMVRSLLQGTKTQTRRIVNPQPEFEAVDPAFWHWKDCRWADDGLGFPASEIDDYSPFGVPGDRLWVRETFAANDGRAIYRASMVGWSGFAIKRAAIAWRPSIHMPRWASRITLHVTNIRVERLQDITIPDAIEEGVRPDADSSTIDCDTPSPRYAFSYIWNSLYAKRPGCSWEDNPWVWAVEFRRLGVLP